MARQCGSYILERTIDDVIFYKMDGKGYVRLKPVFPDIRTSPRFRGTMRYARWMGRASRIGAALYASLPAGFKQFRMYRAFVGEAMYLLKAGKTDEEALRELQAQCEDLMSRGVRVVSVIYNALADRFKQESLFWALVEEVITLLKKEKTDEEVGRVIRERYVVGNEVGAAFKHAVHTVTDRKISFLPGLRGQACRRMAVGMDGRLLNGYRYALHKAIRHACASGEEYKNLMFQNGISSRGGTRNSVRDDRRIRSNSILCREKT